MNKNEVTGSAPTMHALDALADDMLVPLHVTVRVRMRDIHLRTADTTHDTIADARRAAYDWMDNHPEMRYDNTESRNEYVATEPNTGRVLGHITLVQRVR